MRSVKERFCADEPSYELSSFQKKTVPRISVIIVDRFTQRDRIDAYIFDFCCTIAAAWMVGNRR